MSLVAQRVDLDAAKELAYLLYSVCEKKGWAESAAFQRARHVLVGSVSRGPRRWRTHSPARKSSIGLRRRREGVEVAGTASRRAVTIDEVRRHRAELAAIGQRHGVENIRVFGSVARGEAAHPPRGRVKDDKRSRKLQPAVDSAGEKCRSWRRTGHRLAAGDERHVDEILDPTADARRALAATVHFDHGQELVRHLVGQWEDPVIRAIQPLEFQLRQRGRQLRRPGHRRTDHDIDVEGGKARSEVGDEMYSTAPFRPPAGCWFRSPRTGSSQQGHGPGQP